MVDIDPIDIDFAFFFKHNERRSKKARDVDNATTKGITESAAKWWDDPSRHDWPGIDTVVQIKPKGYTRAKGKQAFDKLEEVFG